MATASYLRRRYRLIASVVLILFLEIATSPAMNVNVVVRKDDAVFILISGMVLPKDDKVFEQITTNMKDVLVVLDSPGGSMVAALDIGLDIRARGFKTAVADNGICTSACALVWLAGTIRFAGLNAQLGFHQAQKDLQNEEPDPRWNGAVRDYIIKLGYPPEFAEYANKASPTSMTWLTAEDAQKYGIELHALSELPGTDAIPTGGNGARAME